jgi:hypothetical protein
VSANDRDPRSSLLPSDPFDQTLDRLLGLPNGAHTQAAVVQAADYYGNSTAYMVQSVRWDEGVTVFVTVVNAGGAARFMLPPSVSAVITRQRDTLSTRIRQQHGRRIAAERKAAGLAPAFMTNPGPGGRRTATRRKKSRAK